MSIDIIITENPHYDASMAFVENITHKVDGVFSWTIEAFGGFATAHFEMVLSDADAYTMVERIGKRVAFLSPDAPDSSLICWEGIIHNVAIDDGGTTVARSMENCYNRMRINYTPKDSGSNPPTVLASTATADADDTASIALYGKRELRFLAGEIGGAGTAAITTAAEQMRTVFLSQFANPRTNATTLRRGGGAGVDSLRVSVDCVGFSHELALHFYESTASGTDTTTEIFKDILADAGTHGLDFVSTDTTGLATVTTVSPLYNLADKTTRTYMDELARLGDTATQRRVYYGYYENRKLHMMIESETFEYFTLRNDPSEAVYDKLTGNIVPPHLVRPAKVIAVRDLLPDEKVLTNVLNTARSFVIGSVEFTAPATVVITPVPPDPSGLWGTAISFIGGYTHIDVIPPLPPLPGGF